MSILARVKKDKGFCDIVSRETVLILHSFLHPPCGKTAVLLLHVLFRSHFVILNEVKNLRTVFASRSLSRKTVFIPSAGILRL